MNCPLAAAVLLAAFPVVASKPALAASNSVFTTRPDDPKAAYVSGLRREGRWQER